MSKENDRQKADELLQKLHAAFLSDDRKGQTEPDDERKPEPEKKPEPVEKKVETTKEEPKPDAGSAKQKENEPEPKKQPAVDEKPKEEMPKREKTAETPKAPAPAASVTPAAPAAILTLTENPPDVTGKNPAVPAVSKKAEEKAESKTPAPAKKTRPNAVKIPPRRKNGVSAGPIGQKPAPAGKRPETKNPLSIGSGRMGDISAPRVGAARKEAAAEQASDFVARIEPDGAPVSADPMQIAAQRAAEKQTPESNVSMDAIVTPLRQTSPVIVDFDGQASSTVEPIENTEASETVSEPQEKKPPKRQKKIKAEAGLDATSVIAKRTGLDESDIALIFELGYENELGRLVGYETLKKLKYEHLRHSELDPKDYYGQAFGYRGKEYTSDVPAENVLAAYTHDRRRLILRMVLMVFISAMIFFADFHELFASFLPASITGISYLFPSAGLALFTLGIFLMRRRIFAGLRAFLRFAPTPYSIVAVAIPFIWLYGVGCIVLSIIEPTSAALLPMNFAANMTLLLVFICDAIRIIDEIRTFRMVSSAEMKTILEEVEPRKKRVRQGNRTVKIINDEAGQSLYRVRRTQEIVGFFRRVNDLSAASASFTLMIICMLICAVVCGLATSLIFSAPLRGVLVFAATLMFSAPASAVFLFFDPLRRANRHLISRRSVLVGEGSVNEYSGTKTIIFNDTDSFRAKRQTQIKLPDGDEFRRDIRLTEALFRKIGGTLATVDQPILMEEYPNMTINLVRLTETGVEALIDNKFRILAGDATFLLHSGVEIPKESTDRAVSRSRGVSALFVAINGSLKLTYEIAYTMNQSFREIIALLARTNTTLAVQSYDPNLNNSFLHIGFADGDDVVRVIKPAQFEMPTTAEISDTGVVTLDGPLATAYPLRAASLIVGARRSGFRALVTSIFPGALLAFFLAWLLPANLLPFLPLMAVGYRLIWLIVSWMISLFSLRRRNVFDDTRENLANEDLY